MSVKLLFGDCLDRMKDMPNGAANAVICDLPYGTTQNKWDSMIPLDLLWQEYARVCRGAVVLTASQPFTSLLVMSKPELFKHEWIWIKNRGSNFVNTVREPMKEHESVLVFSRGKWVYNKQMQNRTGGGVDRIKYGIKHETNTENYGAIGAQQGQLTTKRVPSSWQKFNCEVGLHPTQKPVALMEYLIRTYTNEGDTVLDNTMGSGTTGVACVHTGRNFIGIERDLDYFIVAQKRIREAELKALL